jgi:hypothetical protein
MRETRSYKKGHFTRMYTGEPSLKCMSNAASVENKIMLPSAAQTLFEILKRLQNYNQL